MNSFDVFGNSTDERSLGSDPTYHRPGFHLPQEEGDLSVEADQRPPANLRVLTGIGVACAIVLGIQCFNLQIRQGSTNQALAVGNSIRLVSVQPERGLIEDAAGNILAQNTRQLALSINPPALPATLAGRQAVYKLLEDKAGISTSTISFIENTGRSEQQPFAIKTNLTQDENLLYRQWFATTPGVTIEETPVRSYATLSSFGQLLGYVGEANSQDIANGATANQLVGQSGLEEQYNTILTGTPGVQKDEVDAYGNVVRQISGTQPVAGQTLKLSIDSNIQTIVTNALQNAIDQRTATFGSATATLGASAVILNPNNGAVLSMVSLPGYNDNEFSGGISDADYQALLNNPADPLLNRAIQGEYPSGSSVKPLVAATALQDGTITANTTINTSQPIMIGSSIFPDWKQHGISNVEEAIAQSNDIFFYAVGGGLSSQNIKGLGIDALNAGLSRFGLGSDTGIDLPGEQPGLVPGPAWKEANVGQPWYIGDTYHQSIGQGYLLVTPLQMADATAAIANGGTLYQPQIAWSTTDPTTGKTTLLPHKVITSDWISAQNLATVQQGMEMSTEPGGTAQLLGKFGVQTAGKTGTAEFGTAGLTHSWYVGYAPVDHPQYAYAILIEGDGNVTEATESSEPVAEEILRGIFNKPLAPGQSLDSAALLPSAPKGAATPSPTPTPTSK